VFAGEGHGLGMVRRLGFEMVEMGAVLGFMVAWLWLDAVMGWVIFDGGQGLRVVMGEMVLFGFWCN
jgi:hypothetical protein